MNKSKMKYNKQCKHKVVTFYKCDTKLLEYANSINFQLFVKNCLRYAVLKKNAFTYINQGGVEDGTR